MDNDNDNDNKGLGRLAIVGGGISGVALSLALLQRGIRSTIYEKCALFTEIGAGLTFHRNALEAMAICSPNVLAAVQQHHTANSDPVAGDVHALYIDGQNDPTVGNGDSLFTLRIGGWERVAVHRAHLLDAMASRLPPSAVVFSKCFETATKNIDNTITLHFTDGTVIDADTVIAADGIRSSVRNWLFADTPMARPQFTHQVVYRGLLDGDMARDAIGDRLASQATSHLVHGGSVLTYPIAHGKLLNLLARMTWADEWPDKDRLTLPCSKDSIRLAFQHAGPTVQKLLDLIKENTSTWGGLFDMGDHPLPYYNRGNVCLLGDAAHASTPHLGAGAGLCFEDCAMMAELLDNPLVRENGRTGVEAAFQAFSSSRLERTQKDLIQGSRQVGLLTMLNDERGLARLKIEMPNHFQAIWEGNVQGYIANAKALLAATLTHKAP